MGHRFGEDVKRSETALPGNVPIPLFKDRIKEVHQVSQIGFIMIKVPVKTGPFNINRMKEVMRKSDSFCISSPGTILMLLERVRDIENVTTVVEKVKEVLSDINTLKVAGMFIPYPKVDYQNIELILETTVSNMKDGQNSDVSNHDKEVCKSCEVLGCMLRESLNFGSYIIPEDVEKNDKDNEAG